MHVVYVSREMIPSLRCGGIGSYVWDMACQIVRHGHAATVICASDDTRTSDDALVEGVRIIRLHGGDFAIRGIEPAGATPITRCFREMTRFGSYRRSIADCLDEVIGCHKPDLVEFAEYGNEAAEWMCRPRRIPMVVRIHGPASRRGGRRIGWRPWRWLRYQRAFREYDAVRRADAVSCPSAAMAELVRQDGHLGACPIEIIPNAVCSGIWGPDDVASGQVPDSACPTIFTAGTVVAPKGIGELVQAVALLRSQGCYARLVVAGKWGKLGRSLHRQMTTQPGLSSWLSLLGHLPREQLRDHFRSADVVCFPSWWENCPCACLEAMASGGLVLGSLAGGMAEIIRDGRDGFLAQPRDPTNLAKRLAHVLSLPRQEQQRLRQNARERIACSFDVQVIVPRMLAYYQQVIDARKRGSSLEKDCA